MSDTSYFEQRKQCQLCGRDFHSEEELFDHIEHFLDLAAFHQAAAERARSHIDSLRGNGREDGQNPADNIITNNANTNNDDINDDSDDSNHETDVDYNTQDDDDNAVHNGAREGSTKIIHDKSKPTKLQCPKCPSITTSTNIQRHFQRHVRIHTICRQCHGVFGKADQYLRHKCIRSKQFSDDFQVVRNLRKVKRMWERARRKKSNGTAPMTLPTSSKRQSSPRRAATRERTKMSRVLDRNRTQRRPLTTEKTVCENVGDLGTGKNREALVGNTNYHQSAHRTSSSRNDTEDVGMWFRGNMFVGTAHEPPGRLSNFDMSGVLPLQMSYTQNPCGSLTSYSGDTTYQEQPDQWQQPIRFPNDPTIDYGNAPVVSQQLSSSWSNQHLSGVVTIPHNLDQHEQ